METRYELSRYKTKADRLTCPACGKHHAFAPYVDLHTSQIVDESCGRCNREESCGYHLPPREFLTQNPDRKPEPDRYAKPLPAEPEKCLMYLPLDAITPCLAAKFRDKNSFWRHLAARFGQAEANGAFDAYLLGTSRHYNGGACVFPLLDGKGYTSAQIIKVDAATGRTVRFTEAWEIEKWKRDRATTWLHCITDCGRDYSEHADKFPFCFGLHLALAEPQKTVCIVESSKTAVVCSIAFPGFVWLSVGALSWLNPARMAALKGRKILLVPDGGKGVTEWTEKVPLLRSHGFNAESVDLGLPPGDDVADLVFDAPLPAVSAAFAQSEVDAMADYPADWDNPQPLPQYPSSGYENRKLAFVEKHAATLSAFAEALGLDMANATIRDSIQENEALPTGISFLPAHRQSPAA